MYTLFIVLVGLVGLIYVYDCILWQICLFDRKITWLLFKVTIILSDMSSILLERSEFIYSKCSFCITLKNVLGSSLEKIARKEEIRTQMPGGTDISNISLKQFSKKDKKIFLPPNYFKTNFL